MCGIAGFWNCKYNFDISETISRMTDTLVHRGPDDRGTWVDKNLGIALGQRRLSILDLSPAGHQPMSNTQGDIWVVFNGEIYNFLELRDELMGLGYRFKSHCDTEVIIYAYEEWGEKCFERFNGMFAVALWNSRDKRLILARDRLGKKPLYYYIKDGTIAFASELKAIIEHPFFKKEIDELNLHRYFTLGNVPYTGAIFKNTFKVAAGHYMVFDGTDIKDYIYWDILGIINKSDKQSISLYEAQEELEELLKSSVKYRLISDVKLGAFLSGGIDSSTIVSIMAALDSKAVKTFTIGFYEEKFNEAEYARDIAKHLNTEHYELYIKPQDCFETITKLPKIYDEPFADSSAIPTYLVSKMTREHVTVALSGDGGDELFCGYNHYLYMNKLKPVNYMPAAVKKIIFGALERFMPGKKYKTFARYLQQEDFFRVYEHLMSHWRMGYLDKLFNGRADSSAALKDTVFYSTYKNRENAGLLDKLMMVDVRNYLVDDILVKVDRASMANSLESRVPLLDYRIVEFALSLPLAYKFDGKTTKKILRNILYKYVPRELMERPKKGFSIPLSVWMRNELKHLVSQYLDKNRINRQGIFNGEFVASIVNEHMAEKANNMNMIWSMLMFQMWYEHYME